MTRTNPLLLNWTPTPDWMGEAACSGDPDPEAFFRRDTDLVKTICETCSVRGMCLTFALKNNIMDGYWGGMSEDERKGLGRRAKRPRPGFTKT